MFSLAKRPLSLFSSYVWTLRTGSSVHWYSTSVAPDPALVRTAMAKQIRDALRRDDVLRVQCQLAQQPVNFDPFAAHCAALLAYAAFYLNVAPSPNSKRKQTEFVGEGETTMYMASHYGEGDDPAVLLWGFAAGKGFDQVWHAAESNTFYIVEAKGPNATLSTNAAKGAQMSKAWVKATLEEKLNSDKTSKADRDTCAAMLGAIRRGPPPQVLGVVVQAQQGGGASAIVCPDNGIYHRQQAKQHATTE